MIRRINYAFAAAATALALISSCSVEPSMQEKGRVRVRLEMVEHLLKVRIDAPAGTTAELERAEDLSLSGSDPGIVFLVRQGRKKFGKCAFVDAGHRSLDDPPVVVSPERPARFQVSILSLQVIHCLPKGRFRVRAMLVQDDARYLSNEVVIDVKD